MLRQSFKFLSQQINGFDNRSALLLYAARVPFMKVATRFRLLSCKLVMNRDLEMYASQVNPPASFTKTQFLNPAVNCILRMVNFTSRR